jgi:hypothetical protein
MKTYNNRGEIDMYDNDNEDDNTVYRLSRAEKIQLGLFGGVPLLVIVALMLRALAIATLSGHFG